MCRRPLTSICSLPGVGPKMAFLCFTYRLGHISSLMFSILLLSYRADDDFPVDKGLPSRLSPHIGANAHTGDTRNEIPSQLTFQVGRKFPLQPLRVGPWPRSSRCGPMLEIYGRNVIYHVLFGLFFVCMFPVAFVPTYICMLCYVTICVCVLSWIWCDNAIHADSCETGERVSDMSSSSVKRTRGGCQPGSWSQFRPCLNESIFAVMTKILSSPHCCKPVVSAHLSPRLTWPQTDNSKSCTIMNIVHPTLQSHPSPLLSP
jgi:hypothetical protein